ncbi:MAG TPA: ribonucleoside triphosphate reductase [Gammaproteobacteria bacterium]|nr:ribonucleoside triphosphate reductase [Gammaproteobacteria bacterium]
MGSSRTDSQDLAQLLVGVKVPAFVIKRTGQVVPFNAEKIYDAVRKAGDATQEFDEKIALKITLNVIQVLEAEQNALPQIELIQDFVEQALIQEKYIKTVRAYIAYRAQHKSLRADKKTLVEVASSINEYLDRSDWRVCANANQAYSLGGLILNVSGKMMANYWLNHVYPEEIGQPHLNADYHIHDLDLLAGYCAGWSLRRLLEEGFNGVAGKVGALPPKHLSSAVGQMVNFLGTLQNEWAGAQAFSSFDTYLAPYVRRDKLSYDVVKQNVQEFIYNLNVPSRWGSQTPFTNITMDWVCPDDLKDQIPIVGKEEMPFTYGDLQPEMDMLNRAYMEIMTKGDALGRVFTFPIPTYNITKDFPWDSANSNLLFEMTAKYGLPYFQNFINSELQPNMVRSMCCRLQLDLRELLKRGNGLFGSAEQTGSIGVVTINCARLGFLYKQDKEGLYKKLDRLLELAKNSLEIKRCVIQRYMDCGLFPFTKRYLGTLRNHFSTIGVNGMNEMIRNFTDDKNNITDAWGHQFALDFLDYIRAKMLAFQEETKHMYNLEATPAEGTTYRFAKEDKKRYPRIIQAGTKEKPYYTNSSQLPVGYTEDPFEALSKQDQLQSKYTGGTVLHLYMSERISSAEACKKLVKRALETYRLPYLTVTPTFSICPNHGYLNGEHKFCPKCEHEQPCEVWTRVMGYHRLVAAFNPGKKGEHEERRHFRESRCNLQNKESTAEEECIPLDKE